MKSYIRAASLFLKNNFYFILIIYMSFVVTMFNMYSFVLPIIYITAVSLFFFIYNFVVIVISAIRFFLLKFSVLDYINNIKIDIDNTTNTDGEDFLSYLNDFTEISLQDRAYFFDWIFTNPFEFLLYSSLSYILCNLILKGFQRVTISVFKFIKK